MKVEEIFKGKKEEISINIKPAIKTEDFKTMYNNEITLRHSQDAYWLVVDEYRIEIEGVNTKDKVELDRIANSNNISLLVKATDKKAEIKSKLFTNIIPFPNGLEISLTDIIIDDINKRYSRNRQQLKHTDWLTDELIIQTEQSKKILVGNTPNEDSFRIFGKSIAIDVKKNKENQFEIIRIIKGRKDFNPTNLIKGEITIKDISATGSLSEEASQKLNSIKATEKYLKTWEKYQEIEKVNSIKEVEKRGFLTITKITKIAEDKYKLFFKKNKNTKNWLEIEKGAHIDLNENPTLPDFDSYDKTKIIGILLYKKDDYLSVKFEGQISKDKIHYASLSLLGTIIMNSRRTKSLEEIRNNATPMPTLATTLEGMSLNIVKRRKIKALTPKVKHEFGEFAPNKMQEEALNIALNTPDIAIIQGPPGTGKTKVISALSTRLTELCKEEGKSPEMTVLLTAFQHDAVENMASRTEVLGLPTIKYGNKVSQSIDPIESWIKKQATKIEAIQNSIEPNDWEFAYDDTLNLYLSYIKNLNHEKAKNVILKIKKEYMAYLTDNINLDISNLTQKEVNTNKKIVAKTTDLVRNIRTNIASYEDDGAINLRRFLKNIERYKEELPQIDNKIIDELKELSQKQTFTDKEFKQIDDFKLKLLENLQSNEISKKINLPNSKIESVFKKLLDFFAEKIKSDGSIYSVLTAFQNDLTANNDRLKKTIQNYVTLAATTTQGSKGKEILSLKPDPFESVIVDEAARANPLDLLIPLTAAKRRIVLVGDHRQLPHILDNAIQKELVEDDDAAKDVAQHLEDSLFERFFKILKKLEDEDGVKRVVTLNTQYRMHPLIGDFISRTFYEKYGDPKINSGTPAEKLLHNIDIYQNKVAVSVNIPQIKGKEKKQHGSTYRPVEAKEAIRRAKEILEKDPSISVGIISFYSRQVEELFKEAKEEDLVIKNEDGYEITKKYQKTIKGEERFRIGSVDAFQGKEFDVVILSLVRSNNEKGIRRKYGFLTSYNRLNVAMSRAKKLLIAIGDEKMFTTEEAEQAIYGLYAFYNELINSAYGISI